MEENFEKEYEEEKPSILRKIFIGIIILFLLVLIVSYFLFNGVSSIVEGLIGSDEIEGNIIHFSGKKIKFENNTYNNLLNIYNKNKGKEFKACLKGKYNNKTYYIKSLYIPKTYEQRYDKVVSESCYDSIISLHSHPRMFCIPSEQDFESFSLYEKENMLMVVMCKEDRFTIYPK
ncbi:MAG: hypothetical protein GF364_17065 [Candidatus Lokiarchaeota archaeon]|nr:hypothetical protein [Candidatus Lokiarchaeota archaeon]